MNNLKANYAPAVNPATVESQMQQEIAGGQARQVDSGRMMNYSPKKAVLAGKETKAKQPTIKGQVPARTS